MGKSILFLVLLVVQIVVVSYLLAPKYNMDKYTVADISIYDILGERKDTIDVIALGDSLVYSSISPMEIWKDYGYTVFDCAKAAQLTREGYQYLKVAIDTQHPKLVILEADMLYRDTTKLKWDYDIQKLGSKFLFLKKFHNNWKKYLFSSLGEDVPYTKENIYKGFKYIPKVEPGTKVNYMSSQTKRKEINPENTEYFLKIWQLCQENEIPLVILSVPNMGTWNMGKHKGIEKLIEDKDIPFLDLNIDNPVGIDWTKETRDKGRHLNYEGSIKVSQYLGNYLKKTGLLTDHREEEKYKSWWECYRLYRKSLQEENYR